jgi:hypothetical protein
MNRRQKGIHKANLQITVGGRVDVPPTLYPPHAHPATCVPAYVERTGGAGLNEIERVGYARPVAENSLILFLEVAP